MNNDRVEDAEKWENTMESKGLFILLSYIYNQIWFQIRKAFERGVK